MKTLSRTALTALLLLMAAMTALAAPPRNKKQAAKPRAVNIRAVVDSALIMADDYATALTQKPEFAQTRLNILTDYYNTLPTDAARDSVRSRIFDFYVNYVEAGKTGQADAFKQSFLAIAPDTDEHLGPLYANELTLARERFDTTAVKTGIDRLAAYAVRINCDYDEELTSARRFLNNIRTRPHINDILPGVWVSEDICDLKNEFGGVTDEDWMIEGLAILRIRDFNKLHARSAATPENKKHVCIIGVDSLNLKLIKNGATSGYNLEAVKTRDGLTHCYSVFGAQYGYIPAPLLEAPASNMDVPLIDNPMYDSDAFRSFFSRDYYSRNMQTDNDAYAAYIYWGDDKLKVPNPEIGAIIRQSTQTTQALVAGQLSKSKYSFGDRLAGNLAAGLASAGINALVDALMVSTEKIWGIHLVVQMENPYKLHAQVFAQQVKSKSNSTKVDDIRLVHEFDYYRWEPQDSIFFLGCHYPYNGDVLALHAISKEQEKAYKEQVKPFSKAFDTENEKYCKEWETRIKAMPKGDARKTAEKELKDYKDNLRLWKKWNREALEKLKAKSDKYEQENI